jgi:phage shock protein C
MKTHGNLYRDPNKAKIAGVCAGIADYFGIESWLVRILVVSSFFLLAGPFVFVAYIAAWFILEKKPKNITGRASQSSSMDKTHSAKRAGKGWHSVSEDEQEKVLVKSKVWQAGEPAKQAFLDIKQRFENNESRLRKVETYVTSSEFQLNREISRL